MTTLTALAMSAISVFTGAGVAYVFQGLAGEADTPFKRACLVLIGMGGTASSAMFLLVNIK